MDQSLEGCIKRLPGLHAIVRQIGRLLEALKREVTTKVAKPLPGQSALGDKSMNLCPTEDFPVTEDVTGLYLSVCCKIMVYLCDGRLLMEHPIFFPIFQRQCRVWINNQVLKMTLLD